MKTAGIYKSVLLAACLLAVGLMAGCDQAEKALNKSDVGVSAEATKLVSSAVTVAYPACDIDRRARSTWLLKFSRCRSTTIPAPAAAASCLKSSSSVAALTRMCQVDPARQEWGLDRIAVRSSLTPAAPPPADTSTSPTGEVAVGAGAASQI